MKRVTFSTPEELVTHCENEEVSLVIEYRDDDNKQRQVILAGDHLQEAASYLSRPKPEAYYRKDGIFFEVVAGWK
ncbi:hypothetical protein BRE01_01410 [Brevibacillus reuszeri]|uniref:Uncharacterized protein n=1 Tax=Brevibacillus reuszeri TaxID=54915 RepID=A0A0K9YRE3_9BACL|nr:hypothetical protein [Brevibacillus reuszeri]KNB71289.1 hypothetical protein ADS79_20995 [Brevibacillus reuszeri]MED1857729.1 hypothetical protein [Brevibacillus reuszeri]GED66439.1 hypothetical protein BRE01_01410 [Brevibacillus reuszeri]